MKLFYYDKTIKRSKSEQQTNKEKDQYCVSQPKQHRISDNKSYSLRFKKII